MNYSETPTRPASWSDLKEMSENPIVAKRIRDVQDALMEMEWNLGFSREVINQIRFEHNEPDVKKAQEIAREKLGTHHEAFWQRPDPRMGYTFGQWLELAVYSHLVYDGVVAHPSWDRKGKLVSLSLLDTSTIRIIADSQGFIPRSPNPAYQQILYGFPRTVEDDGELKNGFTTENLAYFLRWPRAHTIYGYSAVEDCIGVPDRALKGYVAQSKYFEPDGVASFLSDCIGDLTRRFVWASS